MLFFCLLIIQYSCSPTVSYFDGWTLWKKWVLTAPCFPWEELHCSRQEVLQEATARSGIRYFFPHYCSCQTILALIDSVPILFRLLILFLGWGGWCWTRERQIQQNKEEGSLCWRSGAGPKSWWVIVSLCISLVMVMFVPPKSPILSSATRFLW